MDPFRQDETRRADRAGFLECQCKVGGPSPGGGVSQGNIRLAERCIAGSAERQGRRRRVGLMIMMAKSGPHGTHGAVDERTGRTIVRELLEVVEHPYGAPEARLGGAVLTEAIG